MIGHIIVAIVKMFLSGVGTGMGDMFSILTLWCGYSAQDYCQTIAYMLMTLQDAFTLGVSLAFWTEKHFLFKEREPFEPQPTPKMERPKAQPNQEWQNQPEGKRTTINFVLYLNLAFMLFYYVAIYYSF